MLKQDERVPALADDAKIWRYMGFDKFVALLATRSLRFSRLDQFEDLWEGATTRATWTAQRDFWQSLRLPDEPPPEEGFDADTTTSDMEWQIANTIRAGYFVNCWHHDENESLGLWRVYSDRGVAVQSTFGRLSASLDDPDDERRFVAGAVSYGDHQTEILDPRHMLPRVFFKGSAYSYEQEVRAAFFVNPCVRVEGTEDGYFTHLIEPTQPTSFDVPVSLGSLIEAVYVSPDRKQWFVDAVKAVLDAFDLPDIPVIPSNLFQAPTWARPAGWRTGKKA